jgi:hypothetical protein
MSRLPVIVAVLAGCGQVEKPTSCLDRPGTVFCDDFEAATLAAWPDLDGAPARQTTVVHAGAGALVVASEGAQLTSVSTELAPITTGSLSFRAWMFFPALPGLAKVNLLSINGVASDSIIVLADQDELRVFSVAGDPVTVTTGVDVPRDRWFCLELHADLAATGGALRLDLDGTQIGGQAGVTTIGDGGYNGISAGALFADADQDPLTFYIDDVALSTQPVGCQ